MDAWDLMEHWDLVLPPSRPSALQLSNIRSLIKGIDRSKPVAVLGSTPEFRDLLFENGFESIHVLERNLRSLDRMSALRVYKNAETIVEGDWLTTLPRVKGKFSLILSDLTSGNIPYASRRKFYTLIAEALSIGGIFCDKVLTHPQPHIQLSSLVKKYDGLPLNLLYANHFSCEALFCSELLDIKQMVDSSLFYSILADRIKSERVLAFAQEAQRVTPVGGVWWYGRKWDELSSDYCHSLVLLSVDDDEPSSPYFQRLKFFVHTRK